MRPVPVGACCVCGVGAEDGVGGTGAGVVCFYCVGEGEGGVHLYPLYLMRPAVATMVTWNSWVLFSVPGVYDCLVSRVGAAVARPRRVEAATRRERVETMMNRLSQKWFQ